MTRNILTVVLAIVLFGLGWVAAESQRAAPDFELVVDAPAGATTVTCLRGCTLMWVQRGINPNGTPTPSFDFGCSGGATQRCSSAKVGGWITQ